MARRPVLIAASAVLVAALALFAGLIIHNQHNQRDQARGRFAAAAKTTAALTESVFGSSVTQSADRNTKDFGATTVPPAALVKRMKTDHLNYVAVLDSSGKPLAQSPGLPADIAKRLAGRPDDVSRVLEGGEPYRITGFVAPGTLEYAAAFEAANGEHRVLVEGFSGALLSGLMNSYLSKVPSVVPTDKYILDGNNRVVAAGARSTKLGTVVRPDAGGRRVASTPIGGTDWRVALSRTPGDLYTGTSAASGWIIFVGFLLAGLVLIALLRRTLGSEARLAVANRDLAQFNADLERANDELLRSNGELEQFASVASHDLQEPLRKVQFFGDQIERKHAADLNDEAQDYLRRMRGAANRMSTLIDDLLRFSRVTTQARPSETVDLAAIARDVMADLDAVIIETGATVLVEDLPLVEADPMQMRQLMQNLLGNALKFHRPDVTPMVRLRAHTAGDPRLVAFSVKDNGIGFEPEYEERIFRVFERLHPRDVFAGTGIGLALCRRIAERAGGSIRAQGHPDQGAEFIVELPPAQAPAPVRTAPERTPAHV